MSKWNMIEYEYSLLEKHSKGKRFALETGGGKSTEYIARNFKNKNQFYSINIKMPETKFDNVKE